MQLTDAISKINYALRGLDDDAPSAGDDEYNQWLSILNSKKDELYYGVGKTWSQAYSPSAPVEIGTVATAGTTALTGTDTYFTDYNVGDKITVSGETVRTIATITSDTALTVTVAFSNTASGKTFTRKTIIDEDYEDYNVHRSLLGISDRVYVLDANGNKNYLDLIKPQENPYVGRQVFLHDGNPQILTFTDDIESTDNIVGGILTIPGYYLPADVSAATDFLPVPDPNWLVMATAAEIAFNDIVYETKAPDLNEKANSLYRQMVIKNNRGVYGEPRRVPTNVYKIRGATR